MIVWSRQAAEDVQAVRDHVARDSERYALLLTERIVEAIDRLADFPESGRVVPELGDPAIREVIHGSYRLVYRVRGEAVEVLTVCHAARLLRL